MAHKLLRISARLAAVALAVALLAPGAVQPAHAQTITVTTTAEAPGGTGDCTLGEAIQASNSLSGVDGCGAGSGHDVIELAANATYALTTATVTGSAFQVSGDVTVQGHGARLVHDPLGGTLRFFTMTQNSRLELVNLTLTGGVAQGQDGANGTSAGVSGARGADGGGGAVYGIAPGAELVLDGVSFVNNRARGGRGGSGFVGSNTSYGANGGIGLGGAVAVATLLVQGGGAQFDDNQALGGNGGAGGTLLTDAGAGGFSLGGAVYTLQLDATGGVLTAQDNLAQGGDGGDGANLGNGERGIGGGVYVEFGGYMGAARLSNNRAQGGNAGNSIVSNPSMSGGFAKGGAAYGTPLAFDGGQVVSNTAQGGAGPTGGGAFGGGLYLEVAGWPYYLRNVQILSNTALGGMGSDAGAAGGDARGGGIYFYVGELSLERSALIGNGAIGGRDPAAGSHTTSLGGGLAAQDSTLITNTTFALNQADEGGGLAGISNDNLLTHVTLFANTANSGGGLGGISTAATLRNSLVTGNTASNAGGNCDVTVSVAGANLQYPGNTCTGVTVGDPRLLPVANNGGHTLTAAIRSGSPALNVANPGYCPPTDQRGFRRPVGAGCDLGAYERWLDTFLPLLRRH